MDHLDEISGDLDRIMSSDRRTFRLYFSLAGLIVVVGVCVVVAGFVLPMEHASSNNVQSLLTRFGGVLISTFSTIPIKQSLDRYERLTSVRMIKEKCISVLSSENPSESDIERLKGLVWTLYEKRGVA